MSQLLILTLTVLFIDHQFCFYGSIVEGFLTADGGMSGSTIEVTLGEDLSLHGWNRLEGSFIHRDVSICLYELSIL